nr:retrovirus-related Pol polyprotein from transposon TNT 1-94 [Tanacetum cinerariifolium]
MLTRSMAASKFLFVDFLSEIKPKKVSEALKHLGWIDAMQEELNKFYRNKVWTIVPLFYAKIAIGSKWVFKNKKDKHGTTTKNKARLVSQVYQMDVKSAFLNGKIKEEVYGKQPPGFESSEFMCDRWSRDQHIELLNIIGNPGKGMLTRSMVAKLIASSASKCLFADFLSEIEPKKVSEELKHLGWIDAMQEELNQFYRNKVWTLVPLPYGKIAIGFKWVFRNKKDEHGTTIKIKQDWLHKDDKRISICQERYTRNLLKKYEISDSSSVKTSMVPPNNLGPNLADKSVNETLYRGMIGSLMYLTATRLDI